MSRQGFVFGKILERRSGAAGLLGRDIDATRYPAEGVPLTSRSGEDSITDEGGRMLKLFLVMALMFLPLSVPYGILCFAAARWGLHAEDSAFPAGCQSMPFDRTGPFGCGDGLWTAAVLRRLGVSE